MNNTHSTNEQINLDYQIIFCYLIIIGQYYEECIIMLVNKDENTMIIVKELSQHLEIIGLLDKYMTINEN